MRLATILTPPILACGDIGLTFFNLCTGEILTNSFGIDALPVRLTMPFLILVTVAAPPLSLAFLLTHYRDSSTSLRKIVILYLSLILICASLNFDLVIHSAFDVSPFSGIEPVWATTAPGQPPTLVWSQLLKAFVDCLHFSVVTLSTVGYGDIAPKVWYAKLAVDLEILMGLGITVLAVGRHFSQQGRAEATGV